jgi:hypothetical protein
MQDNSNGRLDGVRDLRNADPDKVMEHNNSIVVPGMTGSCKESGGAKGGCDNFKADQSMVPLGVSLTHERASLKAFKAKYCQ